MAYAQKFIAGGGISGSVYRGQYTGENITGSVFHNRLTVVSGPYGNPLCCPKKHNKFHVKNYDHVIDKQFFFIFNRNLFMS